jgi:hypothetical protein
MRMIDHSDLIRWNYPRDPPPDSARSPRPKPHTISEPETPLGVRSKRPNPRPRRDQEKIRARTVGRHYSGEESSEPPDHESMLNEKVEFDEGTCGNETTIEQIAKEKKRKRSKERKVSSGAAKLQQSKTRKLRELKNSEDRTKDDEFQQTQETLKTAKQKGFEEHFETATENNKSKHPCKVLVKLEVFQTATKDHEFEHPCETPEPAKLEGFETVAKDNESAHPCEEPGTFADFEVNMKENESEYPCDVPLSSPTSPTTLLNWLTILKPGLPPVLPSDSGLRCFHCFSKSAQSAIQDFVERSATFGDPDYQQFIVIETARGMGKTHIGREWISVCQDVSDPQAVMVRDGCDIAVDF